MFGAEKEKKIIEIMKRLNFFDAFTHQEKEQIAGLSPHFRVYQPGDLILEEGSEGTNMFVLLSGKVRVSKGAGTGHSIELNPGEIFGEIAYLTNARRTADVKAETVVIALELSKSTFFKLNPHIREKIKDKIIEKLIQRLEHMNRLFFMIDEAREDMGASPRPHLSVLEKGNISKKEGDPKDTNDIETRSLISFKQMILKDVEQLPPMPEVLTKAQETLVDPATDPKIIARVLGSDQAIAACVLKVANSAYYGFPGKIASIERASALFGTERLKKLLVSLGANGLHTKTLKGYEIKCESLWRHALAAACSAKRVAELSFSEMSEDAYIAGLLHDCGKFILDKFLYEKKDRFRKAIMDGDGSLSEAERKVLGFDHAEIAYELCLKWKIPEFIAIAIRYHHNPSHPGSNLLAHLTHCGDYVANTARLGNHKNIFAPTIDRTTRKILNFSKRDFEILVSRVMTDFNNATQALLIS